MAPLSTDTIRSHAGSVRTALSIPSGPVNLVKLLEHVLPELLPGFWWDVVDENEMGADLARTYPDQRLILIRNDVYEGLHDKVRRDRFTIAHEFGHLFLHQGEIALPRGPQTNHKHYEDSEWQADTFAAEFLMPYEEVLAMTSPEEIGERFLVSDQAATVRFNNVCLKKKKPI